MLAGRISPGRPQTPAGNTAKALLTTIFGKYEQ
jgi:hypothetical protein